MTTTEIHVSSAKAYSIFQETREAKGLTWREGAEVLGLSTAAITRWKTTSGGLRGDALARLMIWSDRPLEDFLDESAVPLVRSLPTTEADEFPL